MKTNISLFIIYPTHGVLDILLLDKSGKVFNGCQFFVDKNHKQEPEYEEKYIERVMTEFNLEGDIKIIRGGN